MSRAELDPDAKLLRQLVQINAELEDRLLTATRSFDKAQARIDAALDIIDKSGSCTVWKIRCALTGVTE